MFFSVKGRRKHGGTRSRAFSIVVGRDRLSRQRRSRAPASEAIAGQPKRAQRRGEGSKVVRAACQYRNQ